jgi:hypothetical protein
LFAHLPVAGSDSADLLYSGLLLAALMLSLWTAALFTAACFFLRRS